ncbi:MAG: Fe-S-containing hydro-lyase [Clostridiales bacterium]
MIKKIFTPIMDNDIKNLRAGDIVNLYGTIYTARDAAHKRLIDFLDKGLDLPINVNNEIIYYVGPCPARDGQIVGSAGPTTSSRMDAYTPRLLDLGLKGMIGKGIRDESVTASIIKNKAVYFGATGGAGALISKKILFEEIIAFNDLGTEAIRELKVVELPLIVIIDSKGNNMYDLGKNKFKIQ